jgi:hypothetical protein
MPQKERPKKEKIKKEPVIDDNSKGEEIKQPVSDTSIDFSKTNPDGEIDTLNTGDKVREASSRPIILGDQKQLLEEMPAAVHPPETVDLNPVQETPGADEEDTVVGAGTTTAQPKNTNSSTEDDFGSDFKPEHEQPNAPDNDGPNPAEEFENGDPYLQTADIIHRKVRDGVRLIPKLTGVSEKKLNKLHNEGVINLNQRVVLKRGEPAKPVLQAAEIHNEIIKEPFQQVMKDEWIQAANPYLAHILKKKGAKLSPEAIYMTMCAEQAVLVIQATVQSKVQSRDFIDMLKELNQPAAPAFVAQPAAAPEQQQTQPAAPAATVVVPKEEQEAINKIVKKTTGKKEKIGTIKNK